MVNMYTFYKRTFKAEFIVSNKDQGPYSQHFTFFITYERSQ